jgi:hypothetical protein
VEFHNFDWARDSTIYTLIVPMSICPWTNWRSKTVLRTQLATMQPETDPDIRPHWWISKEECLIMGVLKAVNLLWRHQYQPDAAWILNHCIRWLCQLGWLNPQSNAYESMKNGYRNPRITVFLASIIFDKHEPLKYREHKLKKALSEVKNGPWMIWRRSILPKWDGTASFSCIPIFQNAYASRDSDGATEPKVRQSQHNVCTIPPPTLQTNQID